MTANKQDIGNGPKHSKVGPSSIADIILCPGRVRMSKGIEDKTSFPAAQGTVAHAICEQLLKGKKPPKIGEIIVEAGHEISIDAELMTAVKEYVDHVNILRKCGVSKHMDEKIEVKGDLRYIGLPEVFGTADYVLEIPFDTLYVRDYKHGSGVMVDAENNPQLMTYALIAAQDSLLSFQTIDLGIVQPRGGGMTVKTWSTTPVELMAWAEGVLKPAVKLALSDDAPLVPGEKQCMWCRANGVCPAIAKAVITTAQEEFKTFKQINHYDPELLTDEQIAEIYPKLGLMSAWIKAIEAKVFDTMSAGGEVKGYKLVNGRKSRCWAMDELRVEAALSALGVDPFEKKIISPAKAEKVLGKGKNKIQKMIEIKEGKPTIVTQEDKREAISIAADDFKEFI